MAGGCTGSSCLWHEPDERLFLSIYYKKYLCSKKIDTERFLTREVLLGSGVWHNTDPDICRASTLSANGRLSCRSARMSSSLCLTKRPVWPVQPFPKAIPISRCVMHSERSFRTRTLPPCSPWEGNLVCH